MPKKFGDRLWAEIKRQLPKAAQATGYTVQQLRWALDGIEKGTIGQAELPKTLEEEAHFLIQMAIDIIPTIQEVAREDTN
jgi:hypothetical protein